MYMYLLTKVDLVSELGKDECSDGSGWQMSGSGRVRVLKFFSGSGRVGFWNSSSGFLLHYFSKISGFFGFSGRVCTFSGSGWVRASKKPSGRVGFSGFRVPDPSLRQKE